MVLVVAVVCRIDIAAGSVGRPGGDTRMLRLLAFSTSCSCSCS